MDFIHKDRDFDELLRILAQQHGLPIGLIEKDYWVTHALWAIHHQGFAVWFKGGTSLSKGFGLIERFSEDLDLKIEGGSVSDLPRVTDWARGSRQATRKRRTYFEKLSELLRVPGAAIRLSAADDGARWTSADLEVHYPGQHLETLYVLSPFVRLEVGSARVVPFLERDLSSFVHDHLGRIGRIADYHANRPPRRALCSPARDPYREAGQPASPCAASRRRSGHVRSTLRGRGAHHRLGK